MAANRKKSCLDEGTGYRVFSVFNTCLLVLILFLTAYPVYFVLIASISDPTKMVANYGLMWLPHFPLSLTSYRMVFRHSLLLSGFGNTLFIVIVGLAFNMVLTVLGAYLLSLKNSLLKKPIAYLILFTMYFSGGLIPYFLIVKDLGMLDSVLAIIIPSAVSTYNCIILRTAFDALPPSLEESARLDGANDLHILFRLYLPLSIPTLAVIGLFYAVSRWNAWFDAVIFIRSRDLYPLQLVLRELLITSNADYMQEMGNSVEMTAISELVKYATIIVATVPVLLIYPFLQKYFVKGMMIGAVKG